MRSSRARRTVTLSFSVSCPPLQLSARDYRRGRSSRGCGPVDLGGSSARPPRFGKTGCDAGAVVSFSLKRVFPDRAAPRASLVARCMVRRGCSQGRDERGRRAGALSQGPGRHLDRLGIHRRGRSPHGHEMACGAFHGRWGSSRSRTAHRRQRPRRAAGSGARRDQGDTRLSTNTATNGGPAPVRPVPVHGSGGCGYRRPHHRPALDAVPPRSALEFCHL
jgi:hypothetical protein